MRKWLGWAALASVPFLASALLRPRTSGAQEQTGFDSFLVQRGDVDTGVVAKKKKQKKKVAAGESGPFENFLKVEEEEEEEEDGRDPAVFSTFLKSSGKGGAGATKAAAKPAAPKVVERPSPAMAKVGGCGAYGSRFSPG